MADPFISEFQALNPGPGQNTDFVEIAVDAGADVTDLIVTIYRTPAGTVRASYDLTGRTPANTIAGKDVYIFTRADDNFRIAAGEGIALSGPDGMGGTTVFQFITDRSNPITATQGPANGLTSTDITPGVQQGNGQSTERQEDGTYTIQPIPTPGVIPCFTRGTLIETAQGQTAIEDLNIGELVRTLDHGPQPVRWIGSRRLSASDLRRNPKLRPIQIKAGALGASHPATDLLVSPQHRMLIRSRIAIRMFDAAELLLPAIKLLPLDGVSRATDVTEIEYFHLMFDHHEIIYANGALTESLLPGPFALDGLTKDAKAELSDILPQIFELGFAPVPARLIPKTSPKVTTLVNRHVTNKKSIFSQL
ncbi:MAG: Hint domain-containing protein [Pseudomonadota bacterium]